MKLQENDNSFIAFVKFPFKLYLMHGYSLYFVSEFALNKYEL